MEIIIQFYKPKFYEMLWLKVVLAAGKVECG